MWIQRNHRVRRVSQEIKKKISIILQNDVRDPRIGMITISEVRVSRDLKNAVIFVTFLDKNKPDEINFAITILQNASKFIRFLLAKNIRLRVVPMLLFKYDVSLIKGIEIYNLITNIKLLE